MAIGGTGTQADPWTIGTPQDLVAFSADTSYWASGTYAVLTADIDMEGASGFVPIGNNTIKYQGNFDGQGHVISNLTINLPSTSYVGLFGNTLGVSPTNRTTIQNIGCVGFDITARGQSAALVGYYDHTDVYNCYCINCTISSSSSSLVGTILGRTRQQSTISNCYSTDCTVSGSNYVGGLVGAGPATISNCYSTDCTVSGSNYVGGLVGGAESASISNCYANNNTVSGSGGVGGLVGAGPATISNCYSTDCTVSGSNYVGGLVGYAGSASISNCAVYGGTHGNVLIGTGSATVTNCYTSNDVTSETFHTQGFWDGTGVSGTTYLSWDFPPWYWDSTNNLPVLQPTTPPIVADLDFSQVKFMTIPEGMVDSISIGGTQVWQRTGRLYQMQIGTGSAYTNPASISWSGDAQPLSKAERTALLRQHCRHAVVSYENGQPTVKYWLYKDDLNYKATDSTCSVSSGEASDLTGTDGDVMLLYDPVWWTVSKADNIMTITFSWDGKFDENAVSPHMYGTSSADATMMSYVGLGVFEGTVSNNQLRSVNVASNPQVSKTEEQFHTLAVTSRSNHYNNMLPMTLAWYDITLMFESGSRNTQASFGNGFVSMSSASAVNTDWSASSAWDSATVYTDGKHGVTACGVQNGWGNVWKFIGETTKSNTNIKFSVLGGGDHYNIVSGYAGAPASWRTVTGLASTNNYVLDMGGDSCMPFLPTTVGASATTGWADYLYTNTNENCCAIAGGRWHHGAPAGAFIVSVTNGASASTSAVGARLQVMIP